MRMVATRRKAAAAWTCRNQKSRLRRSGAPFFLQRLVPGIVAALAGACRDVAAEAQRPQGHEACHDQLARRRAGESGASAAATPAMPTASDQIVSAQPELPVRSTTSHASAIAAARAMASSTE